MIVAIAFDTSEIDEMAGEQSFAVGSTLAVPLAFDLSVRRARATTDPVSVSLLDRATGRVEVVADLSKTSRSPSRCRLGQAGELRFTWFGSELGRYRLTGYLRGIFHTDVTMAAEGEVVGEIRSIEPHPERPGLVVILADVDS